jgi:hypothetical protein
MNARSAPRLYAALLATCATFAGCGSGLTTSVVPSPDFDRYPPAAFDYKLEILAEAPPEKYAVVGFIQVRSARPKPIPTLITELARAARKLEAHAVIPPKRKHVHVGGTRNPLHAYFIQDSAQGQLVEAFAIRYPPGAPSE